MGAEFFLSQVRENFEQRRSDQAPWLLLARHFQRPTVGRRAGPTGTTPSSWGQCGGIERKAIPTHGSDDDYLAPLRWALRHTGGGGTRPDSRTAPSIATSLIRRNRLEDRGARTPRKGTLRLARRSGTVPLAHRRERLGHLHGTT